MLFRFKLASRFLGVFALAAGIPAAQAWEPTTHAYLAELAIVEALNSPDHKVTLYASDYVHGGILRDPRTGKRVALGRYEVDPRVLAALTNNRAAYFAGVCGPDVFPDILTGQEIIHPAGKITPGQERRSGGNDADINRDLPNGPEGPGSNKWLQHIYNCAFGTTGNGSTSFNTDPNRAFVMGFFAHAAGDMFAHTFINNYTGAPFNFQKSNGGVSGNAAKHVILETYIMSKTPPLTNQLDFKSSLAGGVDKFIYANMINGIDGTDVKNLGLLEGSSFSKHLSAPAQFSKLRDSLAKAVRDYDKKPLADRVAFDVLHPFFIPYMRAWIQDIDSGLAALPDISRRLGSALFFKPREGIDTLDITLEKPEDILNDYTNNHLLSMAGLPDAVGQVRGAIQGIKGAIEDFRESVLKFLGIEAVLDFLHDIKLQVIDGIFKALTGQTFTEWKEYFHSPATYFQSVENTAQFNQDGGELISRASLDSQMHFTANGYFDYEQFAPAFNTVTMIKLTLLSKQGMKDLLNDLHGTDGVDYAVPTNPLLGYIETLDGSNQWKVNTNRMFLAKNNAFYRTLFMKQPGEAPYPTIQSFDLVSNQEDPEHPNFVGTIHLASNAPDVAEISLRAKAEAIVPPLNGIVPRVPPLRLPAPANQPDIDLHAFVSVLPGRNEAIFKGDLPGVKVSTKFTIYATSSNEVMGSMVVNPPTLREFAAILDGVTPGQDLRLTLTNPTIVRTLVSLDSQAPAGGVTIELSSDNPTAISVPKTILIPEGETSIILEPVKGAAWKPNAKATLTAHYRGFKDETETLVFEFQQGSTISLRGSVRGTPAAIKRVPKVAISRVQNLHEAVSSDVVRASQFVNP